MPNAGSLSAIAVGHLTQTVDSERAAGDRFKLPEFLRANLDEKLAALEASDSHTALTESDRTGGSSKAREALDQMETLLRDGYNGIKAIRSSTISDGNTKIDVAGTTVAGEQDRADAGNNVPV